jgi:hypothetical protein
MMWDTGRPATTVALAALRAGTRAEIEAELAWLAERGRARLNAHGDVVGIAGLSVTPTRHQLITGDRSRHTWCAIDALGILAATGGDGRIESIPPDSPDTVSIGFHRGQPAPTEAVVFVLNDDTCESVVDDWCPQVNLFRTADAAQAWQQSTGATGEIVAVDAAARAAAARWQPLFNRPGAPSPTQSGSSACLTPISASRSRRLRSRFARSACGWRDFARRGEPGRADLADCAAPWLQVSAQTGVVDRRRPLSKRPNNHAITAKGSGLRASTVCPTTGNCVAA